MNKNNNDEKKKYYLILLIWNIFEQFLKFALWQIYIRWTLTIIKCKKLRLVMGFF